MVWCYLSHWGIAKASCFYDDFALAWHIQRNVVHVGYPCAEQFISSSPRSCSYISFVQTSQIRFWHAQRICTKPATLKANNRSLPEVGQGAERAEIVDRSTAAKFRHRLRLLSSQDRELVFWSRYTDSAWHSSEMKCYPKLYGTAKHDYIFRNKVCIGQSNRFAQIIHLFFKKGSCLQLLETGTTGRKEWQKPEQVGRWSILTSHILKKSQIALILYPQCF